MVVKMRSQFLGCIYFKTSGSPIPGQDELCNVSLFELSFHGGLLAVTLRSGLAHKWALSLHCSCNLGAG